MTDDLVRYVDVSAIDDNKPEPDDILEDLSPEDKAIAIKEQADLKERMSADLDKYASKIVAAYNLSGNLPEEYKDLEDYVNAVEDNLKHEAMLKGNLTQGAQLAIDALKPCLILCGVLMPKVIDDTVEYVKVFNDPTLKAKERKELMEDLFVGMDFFGSKHLKYTKMGQDLVRAFYGLCSMFEGKDGKKENYGDILMRAGSKKSKPKKVKSKEGRPPKKMNPMLDVEEHYGKQDENTEGE